jgi:hypothetical protein
LHRHGQEDAGAGHPAITLLPLVLNSGRTFVVRPDAARCLDFACASAA